jgi:hypothetical protein
MAGKSSRRGGDVQLSKTARASVGDKGSAATAEWSRHHCDVCSEPIRISDMVVIRELGKGSGRSHGDSIMHYHATCSGMPRA